MDVGKDGSHLKLRQPPEPHPQQLYAPGKDGPSERGALGRQYVPLVFSCLGIGQMKGVMGCILGKMDLTHWMLRTVQRHTRGPKEVVSKKSSETGASGDTQR